MGGLFRPRASTFLSRGRMSTALSWAMGRLPMYGKTKASNRSCLLRKVFIEEIMSRMDRGLPKLWMLYRALNLRRSRPELFGAEADFVPLSFEGRKADHAMGYLRAGKIATIVPRWPVKLGGRWSNTTVSLPGDRWKNLLTDDTLNGGSVPLQDVLRRFPAALLVKEES